MQGKDTDTPALCKLAAPGRDDLHDGAASDSTKCVDDEVDVEEYDVDDDDDIEVAT